jgi:hypothetical protein
MASLEPVLGWRVWRLEDGLLASLVVDHRWQPGDNLARCLGPAHRACPESPGEHCRCGFWAVWSPQQSVARASPAIEPPWQVMGLVAGWGTVAVHGAEGFRAERAAIRCLISDRPWPWSPRLRTRVAAWCRRSGRGEPPAVDALDAPRQRSLRSVAARYAVPLLSLRDAVGHGVLGELGLSVDRVADASRLNEALSGAGPAGLKRGRRDS